MNPRIAVGAVGAVTLLLGIAGLYDPQRVMTLVGFAYSSPAYLAMAFGEVRAVYGGLMVVAGVFTLLWAADPAANRDKLVFVGLLWLGAFGGRLSSVFLSGNPGIIGWASLAFELVMGGVILAACSMGARPSIPATAGGASTPARENVGAS